MRGSFSVDVLLGLIVLLFFLSPLVPHWDVYVNAERIAICHLLKERMTYEVNLASSLGMDVNLDVSVGGISVKGSKIEVNGVECP